MGDLPNITNNLMGLFSSLLDEETDISNQHNKPNPDIDMPVSEPTKAKKKKNKKKTLGYIKTPYLLAPISKFNFGIVQNTRLEAVVASFIPKIAPKQMTEHMDKNDTSHLVKKRLHNSWLELHLFLLGTCASRYLDEFTTITSSAGVFNSSVYLTTPDKLYADRDILDGVSVYRIPFTPYWVNIDISDSYLFFESLNGLIEALHLNPKTFNLWLTRTDLPDLTYQTVIFDIFQNQQGDESVPTTLNEVKSRSIKDTVNIKVSIPQKVNIEDKQKRNLMKSPINTLGLSEIHILDEDLAGEGLVKILYYHPENFCILDLNSLSLVTTFVNISPYKVEFGEYMVEVEDWHSLGVLMLTFIGIYTNFSPEYLSNCRKHSKKDIIGVIDDPSIYYDIMRTTKVQGTDLWFFTNGVVRDEIEYIVKLFDSFTIPKDELKVYMIYEHKDGEGIV